MAGGIALLRYRQLTLVQRDIALLVWFDLLLESIATAYYYLDPPNIFLFPIILVGEAGLLLLIYSRAIRSAGLKGIAYGVFAFLVLYASAYKFLSTEKLSFWPSLQVLCGLVEIGLVGLYFRKLMNELQVERLGQDPLFLLSAGLLLYVLGDLLLVLFSNYLLSYFPREVNVSIWRIHTALNIMLYLCYCLALWVRPPQPSLSSY